MSTTFGIIDPENEDEIEIAFRSSSGIRWKNSLGKFLPDHLEVEPFDNSAQGIYTIGDIKRDMAEYDNKIETPVKSDLEKYETVNATTSLKELADVIRSFAFYGVIQGRTKSFDSNVMAANCENFSLHKHTTLTRMYGIRQQAMMLVHYNKNT